MEMEQVSISITNGESEQINREWMKAEAYNTIVELSKEYGGNITINELMDKLKGMSRFIKN